MPDNYAQTENAADTDFPRAEQSSGDAPCPEITQDGSRATRIVLDYDFSSAISLRTKGIRTTNVKVSKASDMRWGSKVHVEVLVSSLSTTIHNRVHVKSITGSSGECELDINVDWSIWDIGLTNAEVSIVLPDSPSVNSKSGDAVHPGIRVDIPSGALGVTMMGSTRFKNLDLSTGHGPAHLSDVAADSLRLVAHNGNITLHDIEVTNTIEVIGKAAWMDIDDLHTRTLIATSTDAIVSLKDIVATRVTATTTNARIGLGNVRADTLEASTCNGEVVACGVFAAVCNVNVVSGDIEGSWCPGKKLYLSTSNAKIEAQVHLGVDSSAEIVLASKNGPINIDLPASFVGGFLLQTTGLFKTFITTDPSVKISPVLHISKPENKTGIIGDGTKRHSLRAITEEAPVVANFGSV
ncbi:hypothetical protein LPJ53_000177 [Coemansia erecta]|uniref:DUF4097 domain-containing protein n=1 Tax=Coemansia erecta TaxID=147472 RepID=A0A9W8CVZ2_9FUNG|nr:hypothetical protein LPJ53_000177 [Coemansia erecta]